MTAAPDLHTLTGAYAAHALTEPERGAFERHLARCPACAQEVDEFRATLARLGAAEAVVAPERLKARVMEGVKGVRQLPPASAPRALRRVVVTRQWPKLALAASLAVAAALGGIAVQQHDRASRAGAEAARLRDHERRFGVLLTMPDARTATAVSGPAVGTVVWSRSHDEAAFLATGMPAPPRGKSYELWFDDAGTMRPAGMLPSAGGPVMLSGPVRDAVAVGVTMEPSGGSPNPTGTPVMLLPFS